MAASRALQPPLVVRVRRLLLDVRCARQHEIGGAGEVGQHDALDDEKRQLAARARVDDPRGVADRARRARVEDVERRDVSGLDGRPERRHVRRRRAVADPPGTSPNIRAPLTLGASTAGTLNVVCAGWTSCGHAPGDRDGADRPGR